MQILATGLNNCPIFNIQSSRIVGFIKFPLVDPSSLKVVIFCVNAPHEKSPHYLLSNSAIINNQNVITIRREDDISEADELVRYKKLISDQPTLLRYTVITQSGRKIGRVEDYRFESQTCFITKLHIRVNPWQRLWLDNRIIDRVDIAEITDKKVIIREGLSKNRVRLKSTLPVKNS